MLWIPYTNSIKWARRMEERLKHLLGRMPAFYRFIAKGYTCSVTQFHHLKYLLFGTEVMEREWAIRHLRKGERERDDWGKRSGDWIKSYKNSQNHPHRSFLVEAISHLNPSSILEIGCNCGPNLCLLAKKYPDAEIKGIDINPVAVQKGNEWFVQKSISNVRLSVGKADNLERFQDKCFDVVFTDAVLIYVGPDKIKKVMKEMVRIARHAVILVEWHSFEPNHKDKEGIGIYYLGCWKRDYVALLKQLVPEEEIYVTKITRDMWRDKNWEEVGAIIKVNMGQITNYPLVSVVIPAYNAGQYINEAIDSLLSQTYKNIEIIVVNDGSTDNTLGTIKEYGKQIKYVSQANKGPSSARNTGIKIAKGEFIAYQDADDVSMPKRVEQEVKYLSDNPDLSMVFTGHKVAFLDNPDKKIKIQMPSHHSTFSLMQHNYIPCTTVMHRKDILSVVGCWNENVDWDLWIRISEKFKIGYIKECLSEHRKRGTGISSVRGRLKNRLIDLQMFKDRYKRKKEMWVLIKVKRIEFECWLMKRIVFGNAWLEMVFWYVFQEIANMAETIIYAIEKHKLNAGGRK